jgi:hypothetical protein
MQQGAEPPIHGLEVFLLNLIEECLRLGLLHAPAEVRSEGV